MEQEANKAHKENQAYKVAVEQGATKEHVVLKDHRVQPGRKEIREQKEKQPVIVVLKDLRAQQVHKAIRERKEK